MNRIEHLFTTAGEEANEVAQRISKALRFGLTEVQPGQPLTNAERIVQEFHDLYAMLDWLQCEGKIPDTVCLKPDPATMQAKRKKVERFMAISREQGVLSDHLPAVGAELLGGGEAVDLSSMSQAEAEARGYV